MTKQAEKEQFYKEVYDYVALITDPFTYSREVATALEVEPQRVSGALRALVNRGMLEKKMVHAGMSDITCYWKKGV